MIQLGFYGESKQRKSKPIQIDMVKTIGKGRASKAQMEKIFNRLRREMCFARDRSWEGTVLGERAERERVKEAHGGGFKL